MAKIISLQTAVILVVVLVPGQMVQGQNRGGHGERPELNRARPDGTGYGINRIMDVLFSKGIS